jgi:hypothetical protein
MDDKTLKAKRIIAALLAHLIFRDWENRTHSDVCAMIDKINEDIGISVRHTIINTMLDLQIIYLNGEYEGQPFYSKKKTCDTSTYSEQPVKQTTTATRKHQKEHYGSNVTTTLFDTDANGSPDSTSIDS